MAIGRKPTDRRGNSSRIHRTVRDTTRRQEGTGRPVLAVPATDMGAISNVRQLLEITPRMIHHGDTRRIIAQHLADIHDAFTATTLHDPDATTHHNLTETLNDARSQNVPERLIREALRSEQKRLCVGCTPPEGLPREHDDHA
jgi:hypothetical protein